MELEDIIDELVLMILTQEKEIKELKLKLRAAKQYIEFYEDNLKGWR